MKKKIEFALHEKVQNIAQIPQPAKNNIPQWYKNMDLMGYDENNLKSYKAITAKACVPFRDAMISGYIFKLWTDIEILKDNQDVIHFKWANTDLPQNLIEVRSAPSLKTIPVKDGDIYPTFAIWNPLYIKTPPGYSVLICSPINQLDTPLEIMSGIVDTDIYPMYPGRVPFTMSEKLTGLIKAGTPLFQIIPFKRDSWESKENNKIIQTANLAQKKFGSLFFGGYRNNAWTRKNFS